MLYPIILHKDEGSAYGVTVPDFPGVFSGGDTLEEALANVQDAIECFYDGEENVNPPSPSALEAVLASEDAQGGAVVRAIVKAQDPEQAARRLREKLDAILK